ncbi:MAG: KH domain-containing protein [Desulfobacterales bacterium]
MDLVDYIAAALVDNPENVAIEEIAGNQASVFELKVAKEDLGKIIGKKGRTAQAIRTILNASAAKTKKSTILEIVD